MEIISIGELVVTKAELQGVGDRHMEGQTREVDMDQIGLCQEVDMEDQVGEGILLQTWCHKVEEAMELLVVPLASLKGFHMVGWVEAVGLQLVVVDSNLGMLEFFQVKCLHCYQEQCCYSQVAYHVALDSFCQLL
jgi:hypothetical protein